ncbi:hypothetical protein ACTD5D_06875 [Nocardia takedensis]|uniref:hypothetical protein n=1 Tax=Nocardia takedensis TaxID=259390 RepID=UPI0012F6FD8A|nr:hypothetical protein [Nocardia takedensis]
MGHRAIRITLPAAAVLALGTITAGGANADPAACLWAGVQYPAGTTITAGGSGYTCGNDGRTPVWSAGPVRADGRVVANPGAAGHPAGVFSPGARQPGTDYSDYCVGAQLIDGAQDVHQVVVTRDGTHLWKSAASISEWDFAPGDHRPGPTWRSDSLCIDGALT